MGLGPPMCPDNLQIIRDILYFLRNDLVLKNENRAKSTTSKKKLIPYFLGGWWFRGISTIKMKSNSSLWNLCFFNSCSIPKTSSCQQLWYFSIICWDTTAPPTDTSTQTTTDSCVPRDVDACLHESPDWNHDYTCASSVGWCESWPKDMQRCCPETCGTGALDEAACNALEGSGVCIYPTAAQPDCSQTTQAPETTESATTKTPSAASTIPVETTAGINIQEKWNSNQG